MPVEIDLSGKVALVTGASRGIGRETALTLARAGANVVVSATENSRDLLESIVAEINSYGQVAFYEEGKEPFYICGDISQEEVATSVVNETIKRFEHLDVVVSNAGVNADGLLMRMSSEQWHKPLDTNLDAAFYLTKPAVIQMRRQRSGSLIYVSSVSAHGNPGQANYAASKAGLEGFMRSVALEYASSGIRANAIACGPVDTDMTRNLKDEQREALVKMVPLGRILLAEEVANTALFLASDLSSGITGAVIDVDGGMLRR